LHRRISIEYPEAVRADHAHAVSPDLFHKPLLQLAPLSANLSKAGSDHHQGFCAALGTVIHDGQHGIARHRNHCQINRLREFPHRGVGAYRAHHCSLRIDWIHWSLKAVHDERFKESIADAGRIA
jgi:hypothetical protein